MNCVTEKLEHIKIESVINFITFALNSFAQQLFPKVSSMCQAWMAAKIESTDWASVKEKIARRNLYNNFAAHIFNININNMHVDQKPFYNLIQWAKWNMLKTFWLDFFSLPSARLVFVYVSILTHSSQAQTQILWKWFRFSAKEMSLVCTLHTQHTHTHNATQHNIALMAYVNCAI